MSLKKVIKSPRFKQVRKIVVLIVGGIVILAGVVMLFFPGPAFVVIPAGFAILATEFEWARRWVNKLRSPEYLKKVLYENSLTLAVFSLFLLCFIGQVLYGQILYNQERVEHRLEPLTIKQYVFTGHCLGALFMNWESEFLELGILVWLLVFLRQRGAPASKKLHSRDRTAVSRVHDASAPWPARKGGWLLKVYAHSLSLGLFAIFLFSFLLHGVAGRYRFNEELSREGKGPLTTMEYMTSSRFWFESFQNWQSEFFAVGVLLVFTIFLRQQGSPLSKPVAAAYSETGGNH